tara:strand:+ start:560 stop:1438 length:879 start_codon:yes stop_codon:yes gene_type:complete
MRLILTLVLISFVLSVQAQPIQYSLEETKNKKRLTWTSATLGVASFGSIYGLNKLWYSKESQSSFHLFDDSKNWMQMDKMGHTFTCYQLTNGLNQTFSWCGLNKRKSLFLSAGISLGYLSAIEIMDGFSQDWGYSLSDMAFNTLGVGLYLFQEFYFERQLFKLKFSFHQTEFAPLRPHVLGHNYIESLLKDYNGQTYWLGFSPGQMGLEKWPKWLMLSFGHSIRGRLKGDSKIYQGIESHRELLFSLDLDLTEIKVKSKFLKALFEGLNTLKIPFPSLIYSNGKLNAHPLYF